MAVNINKYAEEANRFLKELANELGTPKDINHASRVITTVLHTLRERISVEESMHLISQLPMILKGIYVDGWNIREMSDADTVEEFLEELREHSPRTGERDFGDDQQAKENVCAVMRVMKNYVSPGEIQHIKDQLPEPIAALFEV